MYLITLHYQPSYAHKTAQLQPTNSLEIAVKNLVNIQIYYHQNMLIVFTINQLSNKQLIINYLKNAIMNAINNLPKESTVLMDVKEYNNMRDYAMKKKELFKAQFTKDNKVRFTANTLFLAFTGFLDF